MSMSITSKVIRALVAGEFGDPFAALGPHASRDSSVTVRAFLPGATEVAAVTEGGLPHSLKLLHPEGLWEGVIPGRLPLTYRLRVTYGQGQTMDIEDPYRFPSTLSGFDLHLLGE